MAGRLMPPPTMADSASGWRGRHDRIRASMRCCSSADQARTSMPITALSGTVLSVTPALAVVGVTVVPMAGFAQATHSVTSPAPSMSALMPRSGSRPAWAARPVICTTYQEVPLRALLRSPSIDGSSTSTAAASLAASSMRSREVVEPISSSVVSKIPTPSAWSASSSARAPMAWTTPDFMSKTPGPRMRSPSIAQGMRSRVPIGQTVSMCPRRSTFGRSGPHCTTGRPPCSRMRAGVPSQDCMSSAVVLATARQASTSALGDSTSTSVRTPATRSSARDRAAASNSGMVEGRIGPSCRMS